MSCCIICKQVLFFKSSFIQSWLFVAGYDTQYVFLDIPSAIFFLLVSAPSLYWISASLIEINLLKVFI